MKEKKQEGGADLKVRYAPQVAFEIINHLQKRIFINQMPIIRVRFCSANYMGYVPDSGGDRAIGTFLVTKSDILERILGGSASRLCGSIIAKSSQPITWAALIIGI